MSSVASYSPQDCSIFVLGYTDVIADPLLHYWRLLRLAEIMTKPFAKLWKQRKLLRSLLSPGTASLFGLKLLICLQYLGLEEFMERKAGCWLTPAWIPAPLSETTAPETVGSSKAWVQNELWYFLHFRQCGCKAVSNDEWLNTLRVWKKLLPSGSAIASQMTELHWMMDFTGKWFGFQRSLVLGIHREPQSSHGY